MQSGKIKRFRKILIPENGAILIEWAILMRTKKSHFLVPNYCTFISLFREIVEVFFGKKIKRHFMHERNLIWLVSNGKTCFSVTRIGFVVKDVVFQLSERLSKLTRSRSYSDFWSAFVSPLKGKIILGWTSLSPPVSTISLMGNEQFYAR